MSTPVTAPASKKGLNIGLWIVQGLLALAFLGAGFMKLTTPIEAMAQQMAWVTTAPGLVRFIGLAELLGGIGLILPAATRILPHLTAWAATGLGTIMLLASVFHLSRGEAMSVPANIVIGLLAAFVAWGRFKSAPISPRT